MFFDFELCSKSKNISELALFLILAKLQSTFDIQLITFNHVRRRT